MQHDLAQMVIGAVLALIAVAIVFRIRRPITGDTLFLSVDPQDRAALSAGKICNVRMSKNKELADKSHGDVGLVVRVEGKF